MLKDLKIKSYSNSVTVDNIDRLSAATQRNSLTPQVKINAVPHCSSCRDGNKSPAIHSNADLY